MKPPIALVTQEQLVGGVTRAAFFADGIAVVVVDLGLWEGLQRRLRYGFWSLGSASTKGSGLWRSHCCRERERERCVRLGVESGGRYLSVRANERVSRAFFLVRGKGNLAPFRWFSWECWSRGEARVLYYNKRKLYLLFTGPILKLLNI